jgi:hypothetical protein
VLSETRLLWSVFFVVYSTGSTSTTVGWATLELK